MHIFNDWTWLSWTGICAFFSAIFHTVALQAGFYEWLGGKMPDWIVRFFRRKRAIKEFDSKMRTAHEAGNEQLMAFMTTTYQQVLARLDACEARDRQNQQKIDALLKRLDECNTKKNMVDIENAQLRGLSRQYAQENAVLIAQAAVRDEVKIEPKDGTHG